MNKKDIKKQYKSCFLIRKSKKIAQNICELGN